MEKSVLYHFNTLIGYLAKRDLESLSREDLLRKFNIEQVDLLILLGNSSVFVAERAALACLNGLTKKVLISGGIGHSTPFLYQNIQKHPFYKGIGTVDRAESEIFKSILTDHFGIPKEMIIVEKKSTNCGANAIESYELLQNIKINPTHVLLMQDPVLQRRSEASFQKIFPLETQFISFASFIPSLNVSEGSLSFDDKPSRDFCDIDRFLSLLMGEITRLRNDENGYGPKGKNFIAPVEIPEKVLNAYHSLIPHYGKYIRS